MGNYYVDLAQIVHKSLVKAVLWIQRNGWVIPCSLITPNNFDIDAYLERCTYNVSRNFGFLDPPSPRLTLC